LYWPNLSKLTPTFIRGKQWTSPSTGETQYLPDSIKLRARLSKRFNQELTKSILGVTND
jgi:hypothetical protein